MPLVVDVPLNTAIADLDETLRLLLRRELSKHGFEGVEIAFEAPAREWSGKLTSPTVNLFLYDLREAVERAEGTGQEVRGNGGAVEHRPPLKLELTYAVTAWTKAVEDEHRLLSQVLAVLFSYRSVPDDILDGRFTTTNLKAIETVVGRPREEKSDFWSAVGGQYKASIDYVVRLSVESGAMLVRGPEVRTQKLVTRLAEGPPRAMVEMHRFGGRVVDGDGEPVVNAWVAMPEQGLWTASDRDGRFVFQRIVPGSHKVVARTADGDETEATVDVPGERGELVIGKSRRTRKP